MVTTSFQYPQLLYVKSIQEATQLPNGSWSDETELWTLTAACREETNGRGTMINTVDGRALAFSSLIQLPKGTQKIDEGTLIAVSNKSIDQDQMSDPDYIAEAKKEGVIIAAGQILKCDAGRLHTRIWI